MTNMDYKSVFQSIIADPDYQKNLDWGKPRGGHPEGTVRAHIEELEQNLEKMKDKGGILPGLEGAPAGA